MENLIKGLLFCQQPKLFGYFFRIIFKRVLRLKRLNKEVLPPAKVLMQARLEVEIISCNSLLAAVPAVVILLSFCSLTYTFVFHPIAFGSASVPELDLP